MFSDHYEIKLETVTIDYQKSTSKWALGQRRNYKINLKIFLTDNENTTYWNLVDAAKVVPRGEIPTLHKTKHLKYRDHLVDKLILKFMLKYSGTWRTKPTLQNKNEVGTLTLLNFNK